MERKSVNKKDDDQRVYCRGGYWLERCATEPTDPAAKYQKTIKKAEELLKNNYKTGNFLELNKCNKIVEQLEEESSEMCNIKYRNNSNQIIYHELIG